MFRAKSNNRSLSRRHPIAGMSLSLVLGMGVLFVVAWRSNRAQYEAAVALVTADLARGLDGRLNEIEDAVETHERERFTLYDSLKTSFDLAQRYDFFTIREGRAVPCGAILPAGRPKESGAFAERALARGREAAAAGRNDRAHEYFAIALRVELAATNHIAIAAQACLERLRLNGYRDEAALAGLVYILHEAVGEPLSPVDRAAIEDELTARIPRYQERLAAARRSWALARAVSGAVAGQVVPLRTVAADRLLSVDHRGRAFLFSSSWLAARSSGELYHFTLRPPNGTFALSVQRHGLPIYGWVSAETAEGRCIAARRQYRATRNMLGLVLLLAVAMLTGIVVVLRREREVTALRGAFIAGVSHELRTPLSLIKLHAESLCRPGIPAEKKETYAHTILTEAGRLDGLVSNVLDLSRIDRGLFEPNIESVDISVLCQEVLDAFSAWLKPEGFAITGDIEPGIMARTDRRVLPQVLYNLVDNAAKYSGDSKEISVTLSRAGEHVRLRVADQGIGIPVRFKPYIFEPYRRDEDSRVTAKRGSGIGLYVVKQLLDKTGATITVSDNKPHGTIVDVAFLSGEHSSKGA